RSQPVLHGVHSVSCYQSPVIWRVQLTSH
ncbi:na+/H+ antiporter family protein, partial [Vibrio parahaemolyticus V-223/04]